MSKNSKNVRDGIIYTIEESSGKLSIELNCAICGEPMTRLDPSFGKDCENECVKKSSGTTFDEIFKDIKKEFPNLF